MRARPILFSAPMVRALLAGTKSQTRRVVDPQPPRSVYPERPGFWCTTTSEHGVSHGPWECPYGQPGDVLWVRETWATVDGDADAVAYRSDCEGQSDNWRPSIYMPRWASRLTLRLTDVRVQRVQDISEEDARAEGVPPDTLPCDHKRQRCEDIGCLGPGHRAPFSELWDSINAKRGHGWDANPWVWAITFTVEPRNVDDVLAEMGG